MSKKVHVVRVLFVLVFALALAAGCAHNRDRGAGVFSPVADTELTPASTRSESRVYPDTPEGIIERTAPPTGVSADDWALTENIRAALSRDRTVGPYPSGVSITVDKNRKGVVILRGLVPTDSQRRRIKASVAQVPGVLQIDDQIVIGTPANPGVVDPSKPIY
jgi:hypothetical protein